MRPRSKKKRPQSAAHVGRRPATLTIGKLRKKRRRPKTATTTRRSNSCTPSATTQSFQRRKRPSSYSNNSNNSTGSTTLGTTASSSAAAFPFRTGSRIAISLLNSPRSRALLSNHFASFPSNIVDEWRNKRDHPLRSWSSRRTRHTTTNNNTNNNTTNTTTPAAHVTVAPQRPASAGPTRINVQRRRRHTSSTSFAAASSSSTSRESNPMVEEAAKRERANNVSASLPVLEDELELRPVNPRLPAGARNSLYYLLLGYQQRLRGCYGMAVVSLTRSIALSPTDYRPYVNRAYALSRVDRLSDAMHDLEKATELSQTRPENWYNLGLCYQTNQRHQQAIHAFTIALNILQTYHLSSPWNEERRRDAPMYLSIRCATYKSRSLSLRQERRYRS